MFLFLIPILMGFTFNCASAFTAYYARQFGERRGRLVSTILRDVLGIPLWLIGYIMAVRTPSTYLFNPVFFTSVLGWILILAGGAIIITGLVSIRWRAVAPSVQDTLVVEGIYAYIRHPLYSGMLLELVGLFIYIPTLTVLVACLLGLVWVMIQARLEEMDLVERLPAYQAYMRQVPRFVPTIKMHKI